MLTALIVIVIALGIYLAVPLIQELFTGMGGRCLCMCHNPTDPSRRPARHSGGMENCECCQKRSRR